MKHIEEPVNKTKVIVEFTEEQEDRMKKMWTTYLRYESEYRMTILKILKRENRKPDER
jgi:hypothetical protein